MMSNHDSDVDDKNYDSDQTVYPISNIFTVFKMSQHMLSSHINSYVLVSRLLLINCIYKNRFINEHPVEKCKKNCPLTESEFYFLRSA